MNLLELYNHLFKIFSSKNINRINSIQKTIIVSSGKGGVGKSTVAALLAIQLAGNNYKIGLLDADIYGPSIPTIFGVENEQAQIIDNKFEPVVKKNIRLMSIGFLVTKDKALAWRGPMITKSLNQLLFSTNWGDLDYLIIDSPPGTGDVQISLANSVQIDGCIMVSCPDKIAMQDVERAIDLCQKIGIRIIGLVENMSYIKYDTKKITIFGDSLEALSKKYNLKIIAKLPIIPLLSSKLECYGSEEMRIDLGV
ncbi:MAG: Mrp/NBP35 family ATP-binding protein [Rickettsiaceae bacterium]|nr:Mrp/NBP35 family ATP-binding protein [Rickettsiaceae bacterium]